MAGHFRSFIPQIFQQKSSVTQLLLSIPKFSQSNHVVPKFFRPEVNVFGISREFPLVLRPRNFRTYSTEDFIDSFTKVLPERNENFVDELTTVLAVKSASSEIGGAITNGATEVSIAASESPYTVALCQFLMDTVHMSTGLNWWASIILSTMLIRTLQLPLKISLIKDNSKRKVLKSALVATWENFYSRLPAIIKLGSFRAQIAFNEARLVENDLLKQYGPAEFDYIAQIMLKLTVDGSFAWAVRNMAKNVLSFQTGGTLWFVNLAAPDAFYVLPVVYAFTSWATIQLGNASRGQRTLTSIFTPKTSQSLLATTSSAICRNFSVAFLLHGITSNLIFILHVLALENPKLKNILGIPDDAPIHLRKITTMTGKWEIQFVIFPGP